MSYPNGKPHIGHAYELIATDEVGVRLIMRKQLLLVFGELEEIACIFHPLDGRALRPVAHAVGAQFGLVLLVIGLVAHRIPAGIAVL
ncbi:hypothetical protein, partial [Rhizobium leguminosarum]|uniref:hypothetical protein n=1 Tax=Rhizobium leguminosarum TaxID=384 RepID=UPI003F99348E